LWPWAYLLADRSTVCVTHKKQLINKGDDVEDLVIFGDSRALAINAKQLEDSLQSKITVSNYAVPNLGTSLQYYLGLKNVLDRKGKPKAIILSVAPKFFYDENLYLMSKDEEINRFCRFFSLSFLLFQADVQFKNNWPILKHYSVTLIPSLNYRSFVQELIDNHRSPKIILSIIKNNLTIINHLCKTNGQMLYNAGRVVPEKEVFDNMVPKMMVEFKRDIFFGKNIERFIQLAAENNIPIIFCFMPIIDLRHRTIEQQGFLDTLSKHLRHYEDTYNNFILYNKEELCPQYEREYFGDWSHLNSRGADRFNEAFIKNITNALQRIQSRGFEI
jgi:hypothetical protein